MGGGWLGQTISSEKAGGVSAPVEGAPGLLPARRARARFSNARKALLGRTRRGGAVCVCVSVASPQLQHRLRWRQQQQHPASARPTSAARVGGCSRTAARRRTRRGRWPPAASIAPSRARCAAKPWRCAAPGCRRGAFGFFSSPSSFLLPHVRAGARAIPTYMEHSPRVCVGGRGVWVRVCVCCLRAGRGGKGGGLAVQ